MTPLTSYMWGTNTEVFGYLGDDSDVHAMMLSRPAPGDWDSTNLTQAAHASTQPKLPNPAAAQVLAGYPFVVLDQRGGAIEDTFHFVYLGLDGKLHQLYAKGDQPPPLNWRDNTLPSQPPLGALSLIGNYPTTPLAGYPFVVYNLDDWSLVESTEHVIYLDRTGSLRELYAARPGGNWSDHQLPAAAQPLVTDQLTTPIAAYPFVFYSILPGTTGVESTEHVIYIDVKNRLHELYHHAGGGSWRDNLLPGAPLVTQELTTPLAAYTFWAASDSEGVTEVSEHIIYIGMDGRLHELYNVRRK